MIMMHLPTLSVLLFSLGYSCNLTLSLILVTNIICCIGQIIKTSKSANLYDLANLYFIGNNEVQNLYFANCRQTDREHVSSISAPVICPPLPLCPVPMPHVCRPLQTTVVDMWSSFLPPPSTPAPSTNYPLISFATFGTLDEEF